MRTKGKTNISPRLFHIFVGIFLCIFPLVLCINMGVVARALAFPFLYLFGVGAYFIYLLFFINGFYYLFFDQRLKIKRFIRIPALVVIFISFVALITLIVTEKDPSIVIGNGVESEGTKNFFNAFNDVIFKPVTPIGQGYFADGFLDIIQTNHFGGGFLGYLLIALLNILGKAAGYAISITALVIGILLFFLPTIISLVKKQMQKQGIPVGEDEELNEENRSRNQRAQRDNKKNNRRISNVDVISGASVLPEEDEHPSTSSIAPASSFSSSDDAVTTYDSVYYQTNGTFVPARFKTSMDPVTTEEAPKEEARPVEREEPKVEEPVREEPVATTPVVNPRPKVEQIDLFEEQEEEDTSLAAMPQQYSEPVAVPKNPLDAIPNAEPRLKFIPPSLDLLNDYRENEEEQQKNIEVAEQRVIVINKTFESFGVGAKCVSYTIGPSVTRFNIEYDYNVSVNQVKRVVSDIALRLGGETGTRFEQIVTGQACSGLEVPNPYTITVSFKEVIAGLPDAAKHPSAVGFGKNISGTVITADFVTFPHMLLAGTTGSGKSIFIHSLIMTLIMRNSPDDLKLVLIDPKQVEMNMYDGLPHLLTPIIGNAEKARTVMNKLCDEMERRNSMFKPVRVTNIKAYNEWADRNDKQKLPYIFVVFDEYADCHDVCKDIELPIRRLAQKARSAGIHILLATQRPSVDVVTGTLKGNLPTHVALLTASSTDSTVILGEGGAETLLGRGDMLIQVPGFSRGGSIRVQSPFVSDGEINAVVTYLVDNYPCRYDPEYDIEEEAASTAQAITSAIPNSADANEDELYEAVKEWAMSQDYASMSRIQREFSIGFNRAGRLFKRLQDEGIVASKPDTASSAKGCRVLVKANKFSGDEDSGETEEEINTGD